MAHRASLLLESVDLSNSDLDEKQQAQLNKLLHDNHDIFALNDDELGHTSLVEHHIDTGDSRPIYRQPYRVSPAVRNSIDHHVQQMLDQGIIQPSVSPWAAYMSNTVESTLFVRMEWIRNLIRISDSTAFVSMLSNLLQSYEWSRFVT